MTLPDHMVNRLLKVCEAKPITCPYSVGRHHKPNILLYWFALLRRNNYSYDEARRMAEFIYMAGLFFVEALQELKRLKENGNNND